MSLLFGNSFLNDNSTYEKIVARVRTHLLALKVSRSLAIMNV